MNQHWFLEMNHQNLLLDVKSDFTVYKFLKPFFTNEPFKPVLSAINRQNRFLRMNRHNRFYRLLTSKTVFNEYKR